MINVEEFLKSNSIEYTVSEHPAVFTVEEASKHNIPGFACKNLVIKDKGNNKYYLITLPAEQRFDFKKFGEIIGSKKLTFAEPEALQQKLGLDPGSVSPFGLLNDENHEIDFYIDNRVCNADIVGFHPNINTATLLLSNANFLKFLQALKNKVIKIDL